MVERYAYLFWKYQAFRAFVNNARRGRWYQEQVLLRKVRRHASSEFGRAHGFAHIRTVSDFRKQVPITDYEYYRPWIEKLKAGKWDAMYGPGTKVLMFALTSGTTGQPKYIPITNHFFREYCRGWQLWGVKLYWDHKDLVYKKTLKLASDWRQFYTPGGTPCGAISGLVGHTAPFLARLRFALPQCVTEIHSADAKHYVALRLGLACPRIGLIGTANPSTLVEFARLAQREAEHLIRDIYNGSLRADLSIPWNIRQKLRPYFRRRDPARARQLERIVEQIGRLDLSRAWPELSVIAVWTGGPVRIFLPLVEKYYGKQAIRDHGLSASEGHMTVPYEDHSSSGILEYCHHFFEFIPVEERTSLQPTVLLAHELEVGRDYYILLTTSSGFYRYDIRDVVRCTGYLDDVPLIEFLNKGAHFANFTGEKLSESQVVEAVETAFRQLGIPPQPFTLAPAIADRPRYVLLLEPGQTERREAELAAAVNAQLARLNCEYANRLETHRLDPITVQYVPPGTWARLRQLHTQERGNFEEYKHPCLVADLDFIDRVTKSTIAAGQEGCQTKLHHHLEDHLVLSQLNLQAEGWR
ncbi:MAG: GH3 auxin-responsive promoter family protein [Thermoguttaceae bacterium]|nr:GH3 auxin-responsive promoter family protein [Thermoguttaceae bacterium]MDW8078866.1 GH3 auxin-responsive promoter family protein [Thermoguttaceae bacterium]